MKYILILCFISCTTTRPVIVRSMAEQVEELKEMISPETVPDEKLRAKIIRTLDEQEKQSQALIKNVSAPVSWVDRWEFRLIALLVVGVIGAITANYIFRR